MHLRDSEMFPKETPRVEDANESVQDAYLWALIRGAHHLVSTDHDALLQTFLGRVMMRHC